MNKEEIGEVTSNTSTTDFNFIVKENSVKKWDYIEVVHPEVGSVLGQVTDLKKRDSTTTAKCIVIGKRTERGFLRKPKTPIEPKSKVYTSDDNLITENLGLSDKGLYVGLLEGRESLKVRLNAEKLIKKHLAILAKTGAGKCVTADTTILQDNGELIDIKTLIEKNQQDSIKSNNVEELVSLNGVKVKSLDKNFKINSAEAVYGYRKKCKKIIKITTESGREIKVSKEHPLLIAESDYSFKKAEKIKNGEHIAIPRKIEIGCSNELNISQDFLNKSQQITKERFDIQNKYSNVLLLRKKGLGAQRISRQLGLNKRLIEHWIYDKTHPILVKQNQLSVARNGKSIGFPTSVDKKLAEFLALIIAEGTEQHTSHYRIIFTNNDQNLLKKFNIASKKLFGLDPKKFRENAYYIDSNALEDFLKEIGYSSNKRSKDKKIPSFICRCKPEIRSSFLKTFFDCEGCFEDHEVTISTASKYLSEQLLYLLLNFGIIGRVKSKFKKATNSNHKGDIYYNISISGVNNLRKFKEEIGFSINYKKEKLDRYLANKKHNTNVDVIPIKGDYLKKIREKAGYSQGKLSKKIGSSQDLISLYEREKRRPSRTMLKKIAATLNSEKLKKLANSNLFWDKIKKVEELENPEEYVYDLTVKKDHTFIAGRGGIVSHNSYALGVIVEELAELGIPLLIVDPHGEYSSIKNANKNSDDKKYFQTYDIKPNAIKNIKEFSTDPSINIGTEQLKLPIPQNPFNLIRAMPSKISESQKRLLYSIVKELKETRPKFSFKEILEFLELDESSAKFSLIPLIQDMKNSGIFSFNFTSSHELISPGQVSILNLRGTPPELQETIVQVLVTSLFEQRKLDKVPPFFLIIEEAHNFMPERGFGEAKSSRILRTIASEGRKFGLGLAMVSQRPARIDKNVLSQANSQVILQVTNPNDLKAISRAFEGVSTQVENEIKALPIGRALVIGASDYPVFVDVRVRKTQHGGRSKPLDFSSAVKDNSMPNNLLYGFNIMIPEKDVVRMEEKDIAKVRLLLQPTLFVDVKRKSETYHILASLTEPAFYKLDNKLEKIKIPPQLGRLSPAQRKVLAHANGNTVAELFMKTGMRFNEVTSIARNLEKGGLVKISNNKLFLSDIIRELANLEKLNFFTKPTHLNLEGKKLNPTLSESQIFNWIKLLGGQPVDKKIAYLPFYHISFQDGSEKTMDVLSYSTSI